MARTAVVAGTATAVSNRVSRRQAQRWSQEPGGVYGEQPQYAEPAYEAAPQQPEEDPIAKLRELAKLRDDGILTEEEFAAQKAKLLG